MRLAGASTMMVCALCALPALAQTAGPTGSRVKRPEAAQAPPNLKGADQGRVTLLRYADCLADRKPVAVKRALAMYSTEASDKALAAMSTSECLGDGMLRFGARALHQALYISLYRHAFGNQVPPLPATPLDFAADQKMPADYRGLSQFLYEMKYGECIARANEGGAHAVILAPIASDTETAAFRALVPAINGCLPAGVRFSVDRLATAGLLAEVLYKDARAATSIALAEKK